MPAKKTTTKITQKTNKAKVASKTKSNTTTEVPLKKARAKRASSKKVSKVLSPEVTPTSNVSASMQSVVASPKLAEANPEHYFVLKTGSHLKNLKELAASLENMNDQVFYHHVNQSNNDFSNWTKHILQEEELSEEMASMSSPAEMEKTVLRHLVNKYL